MAKTTGWIGGASGAPNDWEHPSNWTNGQPDDRDSVYVSASSTYAITVNVDRTTDNGTAATGTLTITDTFNANDGETVTIGNKTYTWQTTLTNSDGNVLIGADDEASIANLVAAINLGSGAGSTYAAATTLHTQVTAAVGSPANTMTVTARQKNASGNSIATTETMANGSFGGGTLSGGIDGNGLDLVVFEDHEDYSQDIGNSGNPLTLTADKVLHRGLGTLYISDGRSGGAAQIDRLIIDSDNLVDAAVIQNTLGGSGRYEFIRGGITLGVASGYTTGPIYVLYRDNPFDDVLLTINGPGNVNDSFFVFGGRVTNNATCGTAYVFHGEFVMAAGTATTITQTGGTIYWDVTGTTLTALRLLGGVFDTTRTLGNKGIGSVLYGPDGQLIRSKSLVTVTETVLGE